MDNMLEIDDFLDEHVTKPLKVFMQELEKRFERRRWGRVVTSNLNKYFNSVFYRKLTFYKKSPIIKNIIMRKGLIKCLMRDYCLGFQKNLNIQ